ncbi:MAG: hypothetical protein J0I06_11195 [Planctomycetes bacterium]|nr:hypothetical protein [Planctomycetota bacterium]
MRATCAVIVLAVSAGIAGTAPAANPEENKDRIVGVWEIVYSDLPQSIPVGTRLEFTSAGRLNVIVKDKDGKARTEDLGGYKVDKESVVLTGKDGTKNDKGRIGVLNQSSFVLHDEVDDKVMVMKRVKSK